jgi:hypothetical protein
MPVQLITSDKSIFKRYGKSTPFTSENMPAQSKYKNIRIEADGYKFDSKKEAARYQTLKLTEQSEQIVNLRVHPKFVLQEGFKKGGKYYRPMYYYADFSYQLKSGEFIVEDCKGYVTPEFKMKQKLFEAKYSHLTIKLL